MSEYKVNAIDESPPKEWKGPNGSVFYITVGLEGHDKPVSIGKKTPDALKVGDTVHGTIIPTDYLTDKWKGEAPPQGGAPKGDNAYLKDVSDMRYRVWTKLLDHYDIQTLYKNAGHAADFWENVDYHTEELLKGIENTRSGVKEEPKDIKSKLATADWVPDDDEVH